jgi:tRNA(His) guanylyltransferase
MGKQEKDELGNRMKLYEGKMAKERFLPLLPICARLDGKNFSKFTKGLKRPYDERLSNVMCEVTSYLVKETNAGMGYTQSDEISLFWHNDSLESEMLFGGRVQKITSILAAMCSMKFNKLLESNIPEKSHLEPIFDCRVWQVPNLTEVANTFLWRELDASKNSISMLAQSMYSHKQLQHKNRSEMQEMIFQKGDNWNNYPAFFKRGTFIQRAKEIRKFTKSELKSLPPKHDARKNPDLMIERTTVKKIEMPPFNKVTNRNEVMLGVKPKIS